MPRGSSFSNISINENVRRKWEGRMLQRKVSYRNYEQAAASENRISADDVPLAVIERLRLKVGLAGSRKVSR